MLMLTSKVTSDVTAVSDDNTLCVNWLLDRFSVSSLFVFANKPLEW